MHTQGSRAISKNSTRLPQVRLSSFHTRGGKSISLPSKGCSYFLSRKNALSDTRHTHGDTSHPTWHFSTPSFPGKHLRTFQRQDSNPLHGGQGAGGRVGGAGLNCSHPSSACVASAASAQPSIHLGPFLQSAQPNITPHFCSSQRNSSTALLVTFFLTHK